MKPQQVFSRRRALKQLKKRALKQLETRSREFLKPYTSFVECLEDRAMLAPLPSFSINDVSDFEGNTKNTKFQFMVTLSAPSAVDTQVNYTTANGTAIAGSDFTTKSGTLKFKAGETSKNIDVQTIFDTTVEPNETFFVNLSAAVNATIADAQGLGTILNDDGIPSATIDKDSKVTEGPGVTADVNVTLSQAATSVVTVKYATSDDQAIAGLDYVAQSGTLTFNPGETVKTISIAIINDTIDEDKQKFFVDLTSFTNAIPGKDIQSKVEITDDDPDQNIFISDVFKNEGNSGTTSFDFLVTLGGVSERTIKVDYATADGTATAGSDYTAASGTLTFAPGETSKTLTVLVTGDTTTEPHETFFLDLSNPDKGQIADSQGVGTIVNDEGAALPLIGINGASVNEGNSGTQAMTFTVNLSAASASTVTVSYATADDTATAPSDYTAGSGTLTFSPGETSKTITVLVNGDLVDEAAETFFVNLSNPSGATIIDSQAVGTIANDDLASFSIDDVSVIEGNSGKTAATFTVTLSNPADHTVGVDFGTKDGTATTGNNDYQQFSGTLTFAPGETSQTITVLVNGDTTTESDETFKVSLSGATGGAAISTKEGIGTILNDEGVVFPSFSINDVSVGEGDSGATPVTFTVNLSLASASTLTVKYATADGTAISPGDYTAGSGTLTFAPGETSKTVTVQVAGDVLDESNETFVVNLSNAVGATISDSQGQGTITDNDTASFSIDDVSVTEGDSGTTSATFTVTLNLSADHTVGVNYATANGTASSASDYQTKSGTLSFAPGVTSQTITVLVNGDTVAEANETYFLNLSSATGGATITDAQGLGTIVNDDVIGITVDDVTITEGDGGTSALTFTVSLSAPGVSTITVDYATANGTATAPADYTGGSGTLTFAPGETSKTVTVQVVGDLLDESDETFFINLSNAVNSVIGDNQGLATITDNDTASFSIDNFSVNEGNTGTTSATFTVTLSTSADHTVGVSYATADGTATAPSDYTAGSSSLSFAPGQTSKTITVQVNGDGTFEPNETFFINLTSPTGGATITDAQGLGTIANDDPPPVSIDDVSVTEGNSGTTNISFTVALAAPWTSPISVDYSTTDGTATAPADYTGGSGTLTFAPGETSKTVTLQVAGDLLDESDETFFVNLSNVMGSTIGDNQGKATIVDDDTASFLIDNVSLNEGDSGTTSFTFTVSASMQADHTIGVSFATANGSGLAGSDYQAASGSLSFAPGVTSQTITVLVNGDTLYELGNTFFVNLSAPTGGATITDAQGLGTIINDDPVPTLSIDDVSITEGDSGTSGLTFTVTLSGPSELPVTVDYTTTDNTALSSSDFVAASGTLTFAPGETSKTITVQVNGDLLDEGDEVFELDLSNATVASIDDNQGEGTIVDNDTASFSIDDVSLAEGNSGTTAFTFTISLSTAADHAVGVSYATANGTGLAGSDYTAASGTLNFAPLATSQTITILVGGDTLFELDNTFFVNLSAETGGATITDAQGVGTIINDDATPSFSVNDISVTEGATVTFTITLSAVSEPTVTVDYATADNTTTAGLDYTAVSGTLTFNQGETSKTVSVTTFDDALDEDSPETFFLNLSNATIVTIADGQGLGSLTDNDPTPTLVITNVSQNEGNSGTTAYNFVVTMSAPSGRIVTVNYATANVTATAGTDYQSTSGTLTFALGETSKTITVLVNGDTALESNETFRVNLSNGVNVNLDEPTGTGTIVNDDTGAAVSMAINDASVTEGGTATFTVTLSAASGSTITVNYATANGTAAAPGDYNSGSGTLTFNPGETSKTISVTTINDTVDEANPETFFVNLSSPSGATISDSQGLGSIADNDPAPSISISDVTLSEGNSGTKAFNFTVSLNTPSERIVRVTYTTANGTATAPSDYTVGTGTLTFSPGQTSKTVTVLVNGDSVTEANETFFVNLTNPVLSQIADAQGIGTILNDDGISVPIATINDVSVTEGNSGTTSLTFTVNLSAAGASSITIDYATANGTATAPGDYAAGSGTLTFAPGETSKTITVQVNGDVLDESNETLLVNLSNAVGASIGDAQGQGTINDDDTTTMSIDDVTVTEGNSGTVAAVFTVSLSTSADHTVGATYATGNNTALSTSDYQSATGGVSFAAGVTSQTITVLVNGDTTFEPNETFFVNLSAPTGGATISDTQGIGTITNDDAEPLPSLTINDVSVTEGNSGTTNATFTVSLSAASASTVTVDYATADGTATSPNDYASGSGTVTFAPGETSKTFTVQVAGDLLDESNETFVVNLSNPSNAVIGDSQGQGTITDDDTASFSIDDVSVSEGDSGTTSATFTVSLSTAADHTVGVSFATANGSALATSDYQAASGLLSFAAGVTTQTITVLVNGDVVNELDENYFVNLTSPTGGATITDAQGLGTIVNDEGPPTISIDDVTHGEGNSGTTSYIFTVSLSTASASTVTVIYATANATATAGSDYTAQSATLTFDPGETSQTFTILVNGDLLDESDETFVVNLSSPSGATINDGQGVGTIIDDDTASISVDDVTVTEGNSGTTNATFTVLLSTAADHTVGVSYSTADGTALAGSDYQANSGLLSFAAGVTSQTITVLVNGDVIVEPNETYFVDLSAPTGGATITDSQGLGTINNDDAASISIDDVSLTEGDSGTASLTFTVILSNPSASTITVDYATGDGTATSPDDYAAASGTLTFAPGVTSQTITVQVNGDMLDESNESFVVNLSNPVGASIGDGQGQGTINDNDTASFSIDDVSVTEGNSGTTSATFTVLLSNAADHSVGVSYATANNTATAPSDFTAASGTLTFAAGVTSQTITVLVNGDNLLEPDETYFVNLATPTGGATITDSQGLGTITNDEPVPTLSINDISLSEGNSGTTSFSFTVSLSIPSATSVTVDYSTANGTATAPGDYTAGSGTVTFAPGVTSQTITVQVVGDLLDESNETFVVNLSNPAGAFIGDSQGQATINDDDTAGFTINDVTVTEGDSGTVTATFTVSLNAAADHTVGVSYATANGTATSPGDYSSASGTLSFAAGVTSQTVSVLVNGDIVAEANETYFVNLSSATGGATIADSQGLGTINNDDPPFITINDISINEGNNFTTPFVFTVSLSVPSSFTVTVLYATANGTASAPSDYTATSGTLTFNPGETSKTITVSVVGEKLFEGNETFFVNLSGAINAAISDSQGKATILNDDIDAQMTSTTTVSASSGTQAGSDSTTTFADYPDADFLGRDKEADTIFSDPTAGYGEFGYYYLDAPETQPTDDLGDEFAYSIDSAIKL